MTVFSPLPPPHIVLAFWGSRLLKNCLNLFVVKTHDEPVKRLLPVLGANLSYTFCVEPFIRNRTNSPLTPRRSNVVEAFPMVLLDGHPMK